jgi:beta-glucosidase
MIRTLPLLPLCFLAAAHIGFAQADTISIETRVQNLLARMSPEEKFMQLFMIPGDLDEDREKYKSGIFGLQVADTDKINDIQRFFVEESRLGIPIIPFDEALHGLARPGATAFPQAIGLAATWNAALMHEAASAIAVECATRGVRQVLSPVVNIATDPRWGRTEETYGEDPFLASEMGVAFVSAFEKKGVVATPKHFVANVGDGGRDSYPIHANERYLREIHLPPFEACFKRGGARSVMTAYNSYDGRPCTANDWLLNHLLKKEWGFEGFVISDAGSTGGANVLHFTAADYADAAAQSLNAGLDVIFQTSYEHRDLFSPPFFDGSIPAQTIDEAVARVLRKKFELGLFENPYVDPRAATEWNGRPAHRDLARKAARESIVLLKNEKDILPVSPSVKTIAVIGPDADEARLGGYSGSGNDKVSVLQGIRARAGAAMEVKYAPGCRREYATHATVPAEALSCVIDGEKRPGLKGEYFDNVSFSGAPVFVRRDEQIQFQWTLFSPDPEKLSYGFYSVRWTGRLTAPETGDFQLGVDGNDGYRLYLDGKLVLDNWIKRGRQTSVADVTLEKDRAYDIRIDFYEPVGNAWFRLVWNVGVIDDQSELIEEAVQLAAGADLALVVAGIEEGEFLDRASLRLPGRQEELIKRVAATGTPVVVALVGGSAVTMSEWIGEVSGMLMLWYPGEQGGHAAAEVLFGDYSPAGRLPITFPVSEGQLPLVYNHKPTGRGDDYMDLTGQPLFPFGFGLSYTTFVYDDLNLGAAVLASGDSTFVSVKVTNAGALAGDEVAQLYIRDEIASVARPVMELKGFRRIHLRPGETKEVVFPISPEILSMLDQDLKKVVEPGDFRIMIGASSKDIRLQARLRVE